jgi:glutathione peroxidase
MTDIKQTAYDFAFTKPNGEVLKLSSFQGKVLLIVNTASKCGFTKQYASLEVLYQKYHARGLVIIGVPSNNFGKQEPGTDDEIQQFCQVNFGVTFPIVKKEIVRGKEAHPFYAWAKKQLGFGTAPKWNFHKYLVDRDGHLVDYFNSATAPDSPKIEAAIEKLLNTVAIKTTR